MNIDFTDSRAVRRAIAIKQYRFLLKLAREAEEKRFYAVALEYRNEAASIKLAHNL